MEQLTDKEKMTYNHIENMVCDPNMTYADIVAYMEDEEND